MDALVRQVEKLAHIPRRLRDEVTAANAVSQTARAWMDRRADVQVGMFGTTPVEPATVPYSDKNHSLKAAHSVSSSGRGATLELEVLALLGNRPRTCDATIKWFEEREKNRTGEHVSMHATISPRFTGLKNKGHIFEDGEDTTRRNRTAAVWHISNQGRERLERESKPK